MIHNIKYIALVFFFFGSIGCFKDLNTVPLDPDEVTADVVYDNPKSYKQVLAKLYAGFAVSGQQGPSGQADIKGIDEGFGQYLRGYWYHQELTTDEAVIGWNDQTIKDFHSQTWTAADKFLYAFYSRIFYQISLANEFLRETTDSKLSGRGVDDALKVEIKRYRAEARFLRAISYWHGLDLFRNTPFATEADVVGAFIPKQTNANDLFAFIESELKAIEPDLAAPRANEYGRADQAAAWMLLSKLYLNAEVYIGQNKAEDCLRYCDKIIGAGFELEPNYQNLFLTDNNNSKEIIFPVNFDGANTRTWGGMTFIIRAGIGGSMDPVASGVASGWGGSRTTKQLIQKFPADLTGIKVDFAQDTLVRPTLYVRDKYVTNTSDEFTNTISALGESGASINIFEGYVYLQDPNSEILFYKQPTNSGQKFGDNGANGTLETSGSKIIVPEAGLHFFKVNLTTKIYSIQKRNWALNGSATGGNDIPMQWNPITKMLSVATPLSAGNFKFRANGDNAITLGDIQADALLDYEGDGIEVEGGGYNVTLDLRKLSYTYKIQATDFDRRGRLFYTSGQNLEINDLTLFTEGYAINKFKNVSSTGQPGKSTDFPDTDFPMFRLADAYLMAAEAVLRGASGGDKTKALAYFNKVRERAYAGTGGNFTTNQLTLDAILDERGRELYWECHRRTDLVRFGQFTDGSYKWAWKGGVQEGTSVPSYRNIFPIPSDDLGANPNLVQNPKY